MSSLEGNETYQQSSEPRGFMKNTSLVSTMYNSARGTSPRASGKESPATASEFFDSHVIQDAPYPKTSRISRPCPLWGQSSSTWRHTSYKYPFSKDSRFKQDKASHLDIQKLELPSTLRSRSCTFGKGERRPISVVTLRNAKEAPSPDRYDLSGYFEQTRQANKGKSFGIPWEAYKKVYIKHRKDVYSGHFTQDNPEPIYDVRQKPGKDKRKFTIKGRLPMFTQQMAEVTRMNPGAVHQIKEMLVRNTVGLNQRNFGFGERIDLAKPANNYPAPSAYNIKGFCANFKEK